MWNLVKQILKSGFAGCISNAIRTTILLWLETWINLYSTGSQTTSPSGLLCFARKRHFDVWLYWQIGQMLLGWVEADLQTNRDLCYVGMDFEVRHAWSQWLQITENWFFYNVAEGRARSAQAYWTALEKGRGKGEEGMAMQVMESKGRPWRKEPRPL